MKIPWSLVGNALGGIALLIAVVAGATRVSGQYHLAGFEAMTLFQAAVGMLVAACFFKLLALDRPR